MITIAGLNSAVWTGLGKPEKNLISLDDIHYATRGVVTLLTKQVRSSDNNQQLSTTATFSPTVLPYDITSILGQGTPAWVEIQEGNRWVPIQAINKALLEEMYARNLMYASFWGLPDGTQYIDFSYPIHEFTDDVFRIQYDKDNVDVSMRETGGDGIQIPDSFQPYIELEIMQPCIKRIIRNMTELAEKDGVNPDTTRLRLEAWQDTFAYNLSTIVEQWRPQFRIWKNRARTAQNQSRLPPRSGRGFYGG